MEFITAINESFLVFVQAPCPNSRVYSHGCAKIEKVPRNHAIGSNDVLVSFNIVAQLRHSWDSTTTTPQPRSFEHETVSISLSTQITENGYTNINLLFHTIQHGNLPSPQLLRIPPKHLLLLLKTQIPRPSQPINISIHIPKPDAIRIIRTKHHLTNWNTHSFRQPFDLVWPDRPCTIVPKARFVGFPCCSRDVGETEKETLGDIGESACAVGNAEVEGRELEECG